METPWRRHNYVRSRFELSEHIIEIATCVLFMYWVSQSCASVFVCVNVNLMYAPEIWHFFQFLRHKYSDVNKQLQKMPCVVLLKATGMFKIIRSDWIENLNSAESRTHGTPPNVPVKIFFSPNKMMRADFQLKVRKRFHLRATACYIAYVLKICGE